MKLRTLYIAAYLLVLLGAAGVVVADDEPEMTKKSVVVVKGHGMGEVVIDSEVDGIHLDELEVGETRSWIGDDGQEVEVTRTEDAVIINKGGEEIVLDSAFHNHGAAIAMANLDGSDGFSWVSGDHANIHMAGDGFAFGSAGVTVTSSEDIPEGAREEIAQVLKDYGIDAPVKFFNFGGLADLGEHFEHNVEVNVDGDSGKHVRVIKIRSNGED